MPIVAATSCPVFSLDSGVSGLAYTSCPETTITVGAPSPECTVGCAGGAKGTMVTWTCEPNGIWTTSHPLCFGKHSTCMIKGLLSRVQLETKPLQTLPRALTFQRQSSFITQTASLSDISMPISVAQGSPLMTKLGLFLEAFQPKKHSVSILFFKRDRNKRSQLKPFCRLPHPWQPVQK